MPRLSKADKFSRSVGCAVRTLREEIGMTQYRLAARSKVDQSVVSKIERGMVSPTIARLYALARGLGVPVSRIVEAAE